MTAGNTGTTDTHETPEMTEPDESSLLSRRKVFAAGSAGAIALGLAACGGGSSSDGASADPPAAAATTGSASGGAASGGGSATALTKVSAVPVGGAIGLSAGGKPIIVAQPTAGNVVAYSAICPHQGCTVAPSGTKTMTCPCHGSTFDPKTGKNIAGPANGTPLTPIAVDVSKGEVTLKS